MKKFNFKKVTAMTASILLAGASIGFAAAANYPSPFVSGGSANVAVVYGTGSGVSSLDLVQAGNIQSDLQGEVGTGSGSTEVSGGDSVQLSKTTNLFNLGNNINSFFTNLDGDDLETVLADGIYRNDDNTEYDYEQEIKMGSFTLKHFQDSDFNNDEPALGFDLTDGTQILTYTIDFTPDNAESDATDWNSLEGTTVDILGKEYYILSATNTSGSEKIDFLDSASDSILNEGETVTLETSENSYEVSISFINTDTVRLNVNGETTTSLNEDDTYKLNSGDYVGIKEIDVQDYQGGIKQVEFSIGSGKIEVETGKEIKINGDDISDLHDHKLNSTITQSSSDLDKIAITWEVDEDMWLGFGTDSTELEMPVFGNLKLSLGNFVTDTSEMTSVKPDGDDRFSLETTVTDGAVDFNFLYANSTGTGFAGIGKDSDELLETNRNSYVNWTSNSKWFVATWVNGDDHESYVLEISDIDDTTPADNTTRIRSIATGSNQAIDLDIGETDEIGEISFTLDAADETADTADITIAAAGGSGSVNASYIVSSEGLQIQLPWNGTSGDGALNLSLTPGDEHPTTWRMDFTEEDKDGDIAQGNSFNATLGLTSNNEVSVTSIDENSMSGSQDFETSDGSDDYVGYQNSDLATMTLFKTGGDQDELDITYHGSEAYAEVYLSETGAVVSGGGSGSLGDVLVMDSEVSSVSSKNLIIVGGSCINSAAATVLGGAYCGPSFTDNTGVGSGQFLIQGFDGAYASGKLALVVAGYDASDTVNAATYLLNNDVDTSSKYIGTSATSAEVVVESA